MENVEKNFQLLNVSFSRVCDLHDYKFKGVRLVNFAKWGLINYSLRNQKLYYEDWMDLRGQKFSWH